MKQVLQRSGLIEIVKLPEDARRGTTALHAGAANDITFVFFLFAQNLVNSVKTTTKTKK